MAYASDTSVSIEKSQAEIERLVLGAGAKRFYRGSDENMASIGFTLAEKVILFELKLPTSEQLAATYKRARKVSQEAVGQVHRARWRALFLAIKAKLVSVEAGIESTSEAFLAHIVVPTDEGRSTRFANLAIKHIEAAYKTGGAPQLMAGSQK
jgi:hypothetical protein